jgi:DNA helicase-2/ATP-dependent DNA helicase PcrA
VTVVIPGTASDFPLTDEQQAVVDSDAEALVATASAGTGKTEILARRAERFVNDLDSGNAKVLIITYTTRAANEFKSRLQGRIGGSMQQIQADTVHGFAHSILATHGSHVGLPADFQVITKDEDRAELLAHYDHWMATDNVPTLFRELDLAQAKCDNPPHLRIWRDALASRGAVDFGEMIAKATEVLLIPAIARMLQVIYGLVIVDEAQNLTEQQYRLLTSLVGKDTATGRPLISTTLLGDPNQSVTGFAGGDSGLMKRFAHDYNAQERTLTQNFRSSQRLASLEHVVSHELGGDRPRHSVTVDRSASGVINCDEFPSEEAESSFVADWTERLLKEGLPVEAVSPGETRRVPAEGIAVLARHSAALSAAAKAIEERGFEVALAHNEDDFTATLIGAVALLLIRFRSERHQFAAWTALRRKLEMPDSDFACGEARIAKGRLTEALGAHADEHLDVLVPLLEVESPAEFVGALNECQLPESARYEALAGWHADRRLIGETWSEFSNLTPVAERSWTRFALHFDWVQRARDLGPGVRLITVHKAQGREFKAVAVVGMNDGQFPDYRATSESARRSELQAFYVAATRASRVLQLTRAEVRPTRYGDRSTEPSPYLKLAARAMRR